MTKAAEGLREEKNPRVLTIQILTKNYKKPKKNISKKEY